MTHIVLVGDWTAPWVAAPARTARKSAAWPPNRKKNFSAIIVASSTRTMAKQPGKANALSSSRNVLFEASTLGLPYAIFAYVPEQGNYPYRDCNQSVGDRLLSSGQAVYCDPFVDSLQPRSPTQILLGNALTGLLRAETDWRNMPVFPWDSELTVPFLCHQHLCGQWTSGAGGSRLFKVHAVWQGKKASGLPLHSRGDAI